MGTQEASQNAATAAEPLDHKFTIFVDRPGKMVPPSSRDQIQKSNLSKVGHVFIGTTDKQGKQQLVGFYGAGYVLGWDGVSDADRIKGPQDLFKEVAGIVMDESTRNYHDRKDYNITKSQYDKIQTFVKSWQKDTPKYVLGLNNCVTFAMKAARSAGIKPPRQIFGLDTPAGTSISIKLDKQLDHLRDVIGRGNRKRTTAFLDDQVAAGKVAMKQARKYTVKAQNRGVRALYMAQQKPHSATSGR
jgi:hypothetical protein